MTTIGANDTDSIQNRFDQNHQFAIGTQCEPTPLTYDSNAKLLLQISLQIRVGQFKASSMSSINLKFPSVSSPKNTQNGHFWVDIRGQK